MAKTKIVGYIMILMAVLATVKDALDGGGFDFASHINDLVLALNGAGFVFLRDAISKLEPTK